MKLPKGSQFPLALLASVLCAWCAYGQVVPGNEINRIDFGNLTSEAVHDFEPGTPSANMPLQGTGAYGFSYRQPFGNTTGAATGSAVLTFTMACDPNRQNYFSVKLWGNDTPCSMELYNNGWGIEGAGGQVVYPNRFYYYTIPIPISLTQKVTSVQLTLYFPGLAEGVTTRPIYSAFTHTAPCFVPDSTDVVGSAPTRTGQATLVTLTSGSAIGILQANRQNLYKNTGSAGSPSDYYDQVLNSQVLPATLESGTTPVPTEIVGLDFFHYVSNWAGQGYTNDQWRDEIAATKAGIGYSGFPEEVLSALSSTYLLQPFVGTSGTVAGLDHYHDPTALQRIIYTLDGCTYEQGGDGAFPQQGDEWIGVTSSPRGASESVNGVSMSGSTGRCSSTWGGGPLQGANTQALGWAIIQLLNDPAMPVSTGTANPSNFIDYLGQTYDPDLGVGAGGTFSIAHGPMLRAYAYERMLYENLVYQVYAIGSVESQQMFNGADTYNSYVALEKLLALFPNSLYANYQTVLNAPSVAQQIMGLVPTQTGGLDSGTNSYVNYNLSPGGLGEAYGALSCGFDGGGYGQYLAWLAPHIAQAAAWDPSGTPAVTGSFAAAGNRTNNAFDQYLSPTDNAVITNGTVSSDTFAFCEETYITYRDGKNPNEASNRDNFNPQFDASDPSGGINNPYALRAAYLCTQYGLTPETVANNGDDGNGGSLCFLRDLAAYERTIRRLINVTPSSMTPLPAEPGQPDFAWADTRAGAVAFINHGERFYMTANFRSAEANYVGYSIDWNGLVPNNFAIIHDTTGSIERAVQIDMPHDSTTVQPDGNLSGSSMDSPFVVSYGNYLCVMNNGTNSYSAALPGGYGQAEDLISGKYYNLGSSVTVSASQSAIFWLAASGTMATAATAPAVATPASSLQNVVTGKWANLSVLGAANNSDTESNLTYTWSLAGNAPDQVTLSANGTNAAKNTTVTFANEGTYNFVVVITDTSNGLSTSSNVTVTVSQTLTSLSPSPSSVTLLSGQTQQFTCTGYDQFGAPMEIAQPFKWTRAAGTGSVNAAGLYSAPVSSGGSADVQVSVGALSATAAVTVEAPVGALDGALDVGSPGVSGTTTVSGTTYTVSGSGLGVPGTSDDFQFGSIPMAGDCTITARVVTFANSDGSPLSSNAMAGVMVRDSLAGNSAFAFSYWAANTPSVGFEYRTSAATASAGTAISASVLPYWVRVARLGSTLTGYCSPDGNTWTQVGNPQAIAMNDPVYVGLAVCSFNNALLSTATFDNVSITQSDHNILPYDTDIGASAPGSYVESGSTVTMTAQTGDIWGTSDGLHLAYQGINGNGSITARVVSQTNSSATCKAGVTIRNSLAGNSVEVNNSMQPDYGVNFQGRKTAGASSTAFGSVGSVVPPYWVRLTRTGNSFIAASAPDVSGIPGSWTQVGPTETISAVQGTMLFGLDASSNNTGAVTTDVFDNIALTGSANNPPTIATAASANIVSGSTATLSVLGADDEGAGTLTYTWSVLGEPLAPVTFSANGTNAAQNTNVTFTAGGLYCFQVTVTDEGALTITSNVVTVSLPPFTPTGLTAGGATSQPTLSWNTVLGATSYNVMRSTTSGTGYTTIGSSVTPTYTDTGPTDGTTYYYIVTAVNSAGQSNAATQVSVTPSGAPPGSPTGLTATVNSDQVSLTWGASTNATSYNVWRSATSGGPYTEIATGLTTTGYTDTGVTDGSTYYYIVTAADSGGTSLSSSQTGASPAAENMYWDSSTGSGLANGSGTWDTGATAIWSNSSAGTSNPLLTWFSDDNAYFQTAGTLTATIGTGATIMVSSLNQAINNTAATITGGAIQIDSAGGITNGIGGGNKALTINSAVTLDNSNVLIESKTSSSSITINGIIGETGGSCAISKSGAGTVNLASANTYSGGTTVSAGTISVGNSAGLGTGALNLAGGIFDYAAGDGTMSNNIQVSGTGNQFYTSNGNVTLTGILSGSGSLTMGNTGAVMSNYVNLAANAMTSGTITMGAVNADRLENPNDGNASVAWVITNTTGNRDTLDFGNATISFGSMTGNGVIQANASGSTIISAGALGSNDLFSGIMSDGGGGTLGLTKVGSGTMTLSGANTNTGATTITGGTLAVNGSLASGSTVTVDPGGTLAGTGSIGGSVLVNGTLAPGTNGFGTLTINNQLILSSSSTSQYGLGTGEALTTVKGNLTIDGTLNVTNNGGLTSGTYPLFNYTGTLTNNGLAIGTAPATNTYQVNTSTAGQVSLVVTAIPPPSAPSGLTATSGNGQVQLSWNAASGAMNYTVERTTTSGSNYSQLIMQSGTSYTDTGVSNGTSYYYVVAAMNVSGTSSNSNQAGATPEAPIGGAETLPPGMVMTGSGSNTNLAFTVQSSVPGHVYQIQYSSSLNGSWTDVGSPVTGTGANLVINLTVNPASTSCGFYRILIQQ